MTQREPGQDFDPKHRIVGAIIVVALAVIFIPIILSDRESSTEGPDAPAVAPDSVPAEPNKVAVTKLTPPDSSDAATKTTPSAAPPAEKIESTKPATESRDAKISAATPPVAPTPPRQAEPKPPSSGWVVQVGTFSNTANATRIEKMLRAQGQPVLSERVSLGGNNAVRLRVGPFRDRAAALKARERINKDVGVKGVVLAYP